MYPKNSFIIPYKRLLFDEETIQAAVDYMRRGVIVRDDEPLLQLEKHWAYYFGQKEAISVANGSLAGWLSLLGLGIGPGDEVIVPANTDVPVGSQVVHAGAKPVFVDCELDTFNIDPKRIEEKITPKTKAITAVDSMGHPADFDPIREIAKKHDLFVVEDLCHSVGAKYRGKMLPLGDVSYVSFHGKALWTAGYGAMVTTNNEEVAEKIRLERYHGTSVRGYTSKPVRVRPDGVWENMNENFSLNYRPSEIDAVVALCQLGRLQKYVEMQRKNAHIYTELLKGTPVIPPVEKEYAYHVYCRYVIRAPRRDELQAYLAQEGVETGQLYPAPIPLLRPFAEKFGYKKGDFPVTERQKNEQLGLPEPRFRDRTDLEYVTSKIREFYEKKMEIGEQERRKTPIAADIISDSH